MKTRFFVCLFIFLYSFSYASMSILVEADAGKRFYDYTVDSGEIESGGYASILDVLSVFSEINSVRRSFLNVQADISVLGGTFEQTAVLLDGIRINDPQTGHYNFEIPLTILDIEEINIMKNPGAISGAGGYSGVINIQTKRAEKEEFKYRSIYGSYNTFRNAFLVSKKYGKLRFSLSGETGSSAGYVYGTDYKTKTFTFRSFFGDRYRLSLGFDEKDYGAYDFYTPGAGFDSREFVITRYMAFSAEPIDGFFADVYYRSHYDRFILTDTDPYYYMNKHTTGSYGINLKYSGALSDDIKADFSYNINRDEMQSSSMGNRYRLKSSLLGRVFAAFSEIAEVNLNIGAEKRHEGGDWDIIPSISLTRGIMPFVEFFASYAYSLRYPNFTELYYDSPANKGNPGLKPERAGSFNAGLDVNVGAIGFRGEGFIKKGTDVIDWEKDTETEALWRINNIGEINTAGYTVSARFPADFMDISVSYTYIDSYASNSYISKYGITYLKNKLNAGIGFEIYKCRIGLLYGYKNYDNRDDYLSVTDIRISRKFHNIFELILKAENIFDIYFEEIPGIPAMRRYFEAGLTAVY